MDDQTPKDKRPTTRAGRLDARVEALTKAEAKAKEVYQAAVKKTAKAKAEATRARQRVESRRRATALQAVGLVFCTQWATWTNEQKTAFWSFVKASDKVSDKTREASLEALMGKVDTTDRSIHRNIDKGG